MLIECLIHTMPVQIVQWLSKVQRISNILLVQLVGGIRRLKGGEEIKTNKRVKKKGGLVHTPSAIVEASHAIKVTSHLTEVLLQVLKARWLLQVWY